MDVSVQIQANADKLIKALDSATSSTNKLSTSIKDTTQSGRDLSQVSLRELNNNLEQLNLSILQITPNTNSASRELRNLNANAASGSLALNSMNRVTFSNLISSVNKLRTREIISAASDANRMRLYLMNTNKVSLKGIMGEVDKFSNLQLKRAISLTVGLGKYLMNTNKISLKGLVNEWDRINYSINETSRRTKQAERNLEQLNYKYREHFLATMAQNVGFGEVIGYLELIKRDSAAGKEFALAIHVARVALVQFRPTAQLAGKLIFELGKLFVTAQQVIIHSLVVSYNAIVRFRAATGLFISSIRDLSAFGRLPAQLQGVFNSAVTVFNNFKSRLQTFVAPARAYLNSFVASFGNIPNQLRSLSATITATLGSFFTRFRSVLSTLPAQLQGVLNSTLSVFSGFATRFQTLIAPVRAYANTLITSFSNIPNQLRSAFGTITTTFGNFFSRFRSTFNSLSVQLQGALNSAVTVFSGFTARLQTFITPIRNSLNGLVANFRNIPAQLSALSGAITTTFNNFFTRFGTVFNTLSARLQTAFSTALNVFNNFSTRFQSFVAPIRAYINTFLTSFNNIPNQLRGLAGTVTTVFNNFFARFTNLFNTLSTRLQGTFTAALSIFNNFATRFQTFITPIRAYISTFVASFNNIPNQLRGVFTSITTTLNNFFTRFRNVLTALPARLQGIFGSILTVFNNFTTRFQSFVSPIRAYFAVLVTSFSNLPARLQGLSTTVTTTFNNFFTRFRNVISPIRNYLRIINTFFSDAFNEFRVAFQNVSWSSQLSQIGNALRQGFARAIPMITSGLSTSLTLAFRNVSRALLSLFPNINSFLSRLAPLRAGFNLLFTSLGNAGRVAFTSLSRVLRSAFSVEIADRYTGSLARLFSQVNIVKGLGSSLGKGIIGSVKGVLSATNITMLFSPLVGAMGRAQAALIKFQMQIVKVMGVIGALGGGAIVMQITQMQQLEAQLKAVSGSSEELQDTQEYLKVTSNALSVDIGVLSKSYIQLMNLQKSGIVNTDEARAIAEGFSNVAAKTGASADDISNSMRGMAQAFSSGVLQAEELGQMMDPLPGLLQAMDKASGEGAGGFRKLAYAGKVSSEMLKETLIKAFKLYDGEAAKMSGNIIPMMTRLKNSFAQFAFAFNKPVTMSAQPILGGITQIMTAVGGAVNKSVASGGGMFNFFVTKFQAIGDWLDRIAEALPKAFDLVNLDAFYKMLNGLSGSLSSLFSGVFDLTQPQALAKILELIVQAFVVAGKYISGMIKGFNVLKGVIFDLYTRFSKKGDMFSFLGTVKSVSMLISSLSVLFDVLKQLAYLAFVIGSFVILQRVLSANAKAMMVLRVAYSLMAPGVTELVMLTQKYQTQLIGLGKVALKLGALFAAWTIGQWIGEWLWGFDSIKTAGYTAMAGLLIAWAAIKLSAKNAADYVKSIWQGTINGVAKGFAYLGAAISNPLDFMKSLWVDFVAYIRNLVSEFILGISKLGSKLDFLPGMEGLSEKLKNFSQDMDATTEEYKKVALAGNEFTQDYQAQVDMIGDSSQEFKDNTLNNYREFNSEYAEIVDSYNALTGKMITPAAPEPGAQKTTSSAAQYEARRKAYEAELMQVNAIKTAIKKSQTVLQESATANVAYVESLAGMKDAAITDTISSMSDELDNFTKMVKLSNSEVMSGQSNNKVLYEYMTRDIRKHYADREAAIKKSGMSEAAQAAATKKISNELEEALADLEAKNKGLATAEPEIAIAKKQMEFSKQSIELEKQRMTVSVESANAIFTNNIKLIQMEGGTDAEKNKKIIAEQDKLLQAKISAAKKGYEAVSQNLKKSTDDYMAYSEKAISLEQAIRGEKESLADKLREAERKGMDESKAQSDLQSQITEKLTEAKAAMETGDAERAKTLADQAESLGGQLAKTDAMKNVLIESSAIREQLLTKEKATVDTQKQMAADRMAQETAVVDQMKATYDALETDLADRQLRVNFDATQAEITINGLKEKLDAIKDKTVTITVNSVENKAIGGFAGLRFGTGARVPGIGNSDTVPAMLTPGEFVVRKARATRFAGLLNYLNFGSENQVTQLRDYLSSGIQKLNLGGPVFSVPMMTRLAFAEGGGVPAMQPQMVPVANLYIGGGKPVTVYHPTDTAASVVNALQGLSRGRL